MVWLSRPAPVPVTSTQPPFPLTRDLERLDAFVIVGTTTDVPQPVDIRSCTNLDEVRRPPEVLTEMTSDWQRLTPDSNSSLVYAAHYDTRWRPAPLIQVIGVSSRRDLDRLVCRLWFSDTPQPVYSRATVHVISETHGRRFVSVSSCLFKCFKGKSLVLGQSLLIQPNTVL